MQMTMVKTFVASASELQSSDLYMTVKATLFTTPSANLNGVRCTAAFLNEIVEHQDKYIGLPLCADVSNLTKGQYDKLGHCYDPKTGVFSSSIIGSFYQFEKEEREDGETALIGYARILKRNRNVCHAISELFADNALKFSFEIACGAYTELEDGTVEIDKSDKNYIEGMCVVSFPACPEAVATLLVAEIMDGNKDPMKEAATMPNEKVEALEPQTEVLAEAAQEPQEKAAAAAETAEAEAPTQETAEATQAEASEATDETAEVIVVEHKKEIQDLSAFDTEDGSSIEEHFVHETTTVTPIDNTNESTGYAAPVIIPAEDAAEDTTETAAEAEEATVDATAETSTEVASLETIVAELKDMVEKLQAELAEIRQERKPQDVIAQVAETVAAQVNPFVGEMHTEKKYSLLDPPEKHDKYTLL